MAYKLLDAAQQRWRRFRGHELIADVLDGVDFKDGERGIDEDNDSIDEKGDIPRRAICFAPPAAKEVRRDVAAARP